MTIAPTRFAEDELNELRDMRPLNDPTAFQTLQPAINHAVLEPVYETFDAVQIFNTWAGILPAGEFEMVACQPAMRWFAGGSTSLSSNKLKRCARLAQASPFFPTAGDSWNEWD